MNFEHFFLRFGDLKFVIIFEEGKMKNDLLKKL